MLIRKLRMHSKIDPREESEFRELSIRPRALAPGEDLIREGDHPHRSAVVLEGWVARYATLPTGQRQYLSLHMPGDWPDAQGLYLERMDHAVCALGAATIGTVRHDQLHALFDRRPAAGAALWRETLVDAAIFRQAIVNNSARGAVQRFAHLLCELYLRGRRAGLVDGESGMTVPLVQEQLGEVLGLALVTINRALKAIRSTGAADLRQQRLIVADWQKLVTFADFDPAYLHV